MASAEANYATELAAAEQRLNLLKRKAFARAKARGENPAEESQRDALGGAQSGTGVAERNSTANGAAEGAAPPNELQRLVAAYLLEASGSVPMDSHKIHRELSKPEGKGKAYEAALGGGGIPALEAALRALGGGETPALELEDFEVAGKQRVMVLDVTRARLVTLLGRDPAKAAELALPPPPALQPVPGQPVPPLPFRVPNGAPNGMPGMPGMPGLPGGIGVLPPPPMTHIGVPPPPVAMRRDPATSPFPPPPAAVTPVTQPAKVDLEAILGHKSIGDRKKTEKGEELLELLQKPTAKENATVEKFRMGGTAVKEYCPQLTKEDCCRVNNMPVACGKLHFRRLLFEWTDTGLGNCNYLDTCRHMHNCKFVHYELDGAVAPAAGRNGKGAATRPSLRDGPPVPSYLQALQEPQWINCDVRKFDMSVLGKFGVIMTDPPWEIHQDLPYGTMADDEMRKLNIGCLQDHGVIFVWVTGRAMELGRECLDVWGYKRVDELIWVKTNQLQRLIRTGRTGHWLNHSKEHCLVGYKGNPQLNRGVDTDVVVAEVRETSRKPDEMYSLLERLSPGTRKLEIFARQHNCQPGWVGLGNQLDNTNIKDPDLLARFNEVYGEGKKDPLKG